MQRLRVPTLCRYASFQYSTKDTCVSKYLQIYGRYGLNRIVARSYKTSSCLPYYLQASSYHNNNSVICKRYKHAASNQDKSTEESSQLAEEPPEKLSLFQRYKKMLKEYWYVLIPVHMVTSAFWFGGFFYAAKSGIDIIPILEYVNLPEILITPLRSSSLGNIAVASALYKLATPARYMVTVGGTTFAVKFLTKRGLIRPVPTKAEIKTLIQNKLKKDNIESEK
ncbi:Protein FAM210A [Araneus ventricosus]|uniref:Protein FAM210A n=1 Tax=Araneus ventricosus TaxID=182803 RepID=A0A4Y2J8R7_ARAVE|nr:Protein FAM210A [Araneus ventricosus]